jgi:hypothetical protein
MVPVWRRAVLGPAVDGLRQRMGIVTGRQGWSVDEITMTDARSRINGGDRHYRLAQDGANPEGRGVIAWCEVEKKAMLERNAAEKASS